MRVPAGAYLAALSRKIEQRLFQENPVQRQHGQVLGAIDADAVVGEDLPARCSAGAADDLLDVGQLPLDVETAELEPRGVEQIAAQSG